MSHDDDPLSTVTRAASTSRGQPGPHAVLRAVAPDLHWSIPLAEDPQVIGRITAPGQTPALAHKTVSRRHFEVYWDAQTQRHHGRDLGSHNGSRIDGQDIARATVPLRDQSVIQLGDVCLVYELAQRGVAADTPDPSAASIPGRAPAMVALRQTMARAAPDPSPVLLLGDTGTGKEWIARELHRLSERPGPLVAINCSALSPQIVDSQLFGHVKGAFTGATSEQPGLFRAAEGGTLFLDEIGDLPLELQPKLLRALQEGEIQPVGSTKLLTVDVRVVAATHTGLIDRVEAGQFRRDLYARLALWELRVPALRQRRGDLLTWLERLHADWRAKRPELDSPPLTLSPEAAEALLLHAWPSNLRELDRLVHELASTPDLPRPVELERLPPWLGSSGNSAGAAAPSSSPSPREGPAAAPKPPVPTREEFIAVFERLEGNVRAMAKHFARDRRQIYRWIESHGLADRRGRGN